jgi:hypothetical protein
VVVALLSNEPPQVLITYQGFTDEEYRKHVLQRHPILCMGCKPKVTQKLEKVDLWFKRDFLYSRLQLSREAAYGPRNKPGTKWASSKHWLSDDCLVILRIISVTFCVSFLLYPASFNHAPQDRAILFLGTLYFAFFIYQLISLHTKEWSRVVHNVYFSLQVVGALWVLSQQGDATKSQMVLFIILLITLWNWEDSDTFLPRGKLSFQTDEDLNLSDQSLDEVLMELFQPSHRRRRNRKEDRVGSIAFAGSVIVYLQGFRNFALLCMAAVVWNYFKQFTVLIFNVVQICCGMWCTGSRSIWKCNHLSVVELGNHIFNVDHHQCAVNLMLNSAYFFRQYVC